MNTQLVMNRRESELFRPEEIEYAKRIVTVVCLGEGGEDTRTRISLPYEGSASSEFNSLLHTVMPKFD